MGLVTSNSVTVFCFRYSEIEVTPSLSSIEKRVMGRYERSSPMSVMSVPWRVVTNGSRRPAFASICRASNALTECGIA